MNEVGLGMNVDPLSEMLALSSCANTKNVLINLVELEGPYDIDALKDAVAKTADGFPELRSCLKEVRDRGGYRLVREARPDLELPFKIRRVQDYDPSRPVLDTYFDLFQEELDRTWDLFNEPPAEFHFVALKDDLFVGGIIIHHAAADGATASEVGKQVFLAYCENLFGERPPASDITPAVSTSDKRKARKRKRTWRDFIYQAKHSLIPLTHRHVLPAGSGSPRDQGQHQVKRVLTEEESAEIMKGSLKKRVSLIDLLVVCVNRAIDQWNADRNIPRGSLTTSMTVNMRGRFGGLDTPNSSGLLYFVSRPEERKDPATFARTISMARIKQFRKHMDGHFYENVTRMNTFLRLLPFRLKQPMVHRLMQAHQLSVAVTLMGVIWPEIKQGRPTGESSLASFHDLTVREIHGLGYKLLSNTHVLLIVHTFRKRLNLVLAASACHFSRKEADDFLDLIRELLLNSV